MSKNGYLIKSKDGVSLMTLFLNTLPASNYFLLRGFPEDRVLCLFSDLQ